MYKFIIRNSSVFWRPQKPQYFEIYINTRQTDTIALINNYFGICGKSFLAIWSKKIIEHYCDLLQTCWVCVFRNFISQPIENFQKNSWMKYFGCIFQSMSSICKCFMYAVTISIAVSLSIKQCNNISIYYCAHDYIQLAQTIIYCSIYWIENIVNGNAKICSSDWE